MGGRRATEAILDCENARKRARVGKNGEDDTRMVLAESTNLRRETENSHYSFSLDSTDDDSGDTEPEMDHAAVHAEEESSSYGSETGESEVSSEDGNAEEENAEDEASSDGSVAGESKGEEEKLEGSDGELNPECDESDGGEPDGDPVQTREPNNKPNPNSQANPIIFLV